MHAALVGAHADGAYREAMRLALALRDYWELDGMPLPSQQALESALSRAGSDWPATLRCDAHELLAYTAIGAGDGSHALAQADAALALAGDDPARRGRCQLRRAWVCLAADYQAPGQAGPLADAMDLARSCGDTALQARTLHQQGILARFQERDLARADALFARAQSLWQDLGNQRLAHSRLRNRAQCWAAQGRHADALASFRQCEQAAQADGDWVGIIDSTLGAASALTRLRRWDEALATQRECIRVAWQRHHAHGLAYALWNIAHPMLRSGRVENAVRLMSFAAAYWTGHMGPLRADDEREMHKLRRLARVRLHDATLESLWIEGRTLTIADAVARALRN